MSDPATELFDALRAQIPHMTADLAKTVRGVLGPELLRQMTVEQHQRLVREIEGGFRHAVGSFLGPFNNVGCVLKGPVAGFRIVPRYLPGMQGGPEDIARDGMDYADMWRDLHEIPAGPLSEKIAAIVDARQTKVQSDPNES